MYTLINYIKVLISIKLLLATLISYSQIGIGTNAPDSCAELEIFSETKGILIPRLTNVQLSGVTHEDALLVYNSSTGQFMLSLDANWYVLNPWKGDQDKIYTESEKVGIGTNDPQATLDIDGEIRVGSVDTPGSKKGTIYFDSSTNHLMVNDGSWKKIPYDTDEDGVIDEKDEYIENPTNYNLKTDSVKQGKTYWADGELKTGTMTEFTNVLLPVSIGKNAVIYSEPGFYNSFIIQGDANLISSNIRNGVNIFSCTGTYCTGGTFNWVVDTWGRCHPFINYFEKWPETKHCEDCDGIRVNDSNCSGVTEPGPVSCDPNDEF